MAAPRDVAWEPLPAELARDASAAVEDNDDDAARAFAARWADADDEPPPLDSLPGQLEGLRVHAAEQQRAGAASGAGGASRTAPASAAPSGGASGSTPKAPAATPPKPAGVKRGFFDAPPRAKATAPAKVGHATLLPSQAFATVSPDTRAAAQAPAPALTELKAASRPKHAGPAIPEFLKARAPHILCSDRPRVLPHAGQRTCDV